MKSLLPNWLLLLLLWGAQQGLSQINTNYGDAGISQFSVGPASDVALCGALQPDGKLVVAGYTDNGNDLDLFVARLLVDGQLDLSFGNQGLFSYDFNGEDDYVKGLTVGPNGHIYFAATTSVGGQKDPLIGRLTTYGSFDTSFGASGVVWFNPSTENEEVEALAIAADESLFLCGQTKVGDARNGFVLKTLANGSYDPNFGSNGFLELNYPGDDRLEDIVLGNDGNLFLAGTREGYGEMVVVKLNSQGLLDGTFGQSGFATYSDPLGVPIGNRLVLRPSGEIVLAGAISYFDYNQWAVVQFLADGSLDPNFGEQGLVSVGAPGQWTFINGLELLSDESILLGGNTTTNSETQAFWSRIDVSGNLDLSLGTGGFVSYADVSQEALVNGIAYSEQEGLYLFGATGQTNPGQTYQVTAWNYLPVPVTRTEHLLVNPDVGRVYPNPCEDGVLYLEDIPASGANFYYQWMDGLGRSIGGLQLLEGTSEAQLIQLPGIFKPGWYTLLLYQNNQVYGQHRILIP